MGKLKDQLAGIAALIAAIVAIGGGFVKYGEIKEHRIQESMAECLRARRVAEREYNPNISYKCIRSEAETEVYLGEKSIKKLILSK